MSTTKQKTGAKRNIKKGQKTRSGHSGKGASKKSTSMRAAKKDRLETEKFAFPKDRKEPIHDAKHVRNAISRFNQVEGVSDAERDRAWKRIMKAAKKFDIDVSEDSWRELGSTKSSKGKNLKGKR